MITTKNNELLLVGGFSHQSKTVVNTLLVLDGISSKWREIKVPLKKLRMDHLAFIPTKEEINIFCGKTSKNKKTRNEAAYLKKSTFRQEVHE